MHSVTRTEIRPFRIEVSDAVLDDLRDRLRRTRWPEPLDDPEWEYGVEQGYLQDLARYWAEQYDWRKHEAELNRFAQFVTEIDSQTIHFLHVRSPHADALPLVVTHGWPGSIAEFTKIIDPLTNPTAHGGEARDAFHVVCPSIPGYGFSQPNSSKGWHTQRVAKAWAELMRRLGYERYGAQGGDWGSYISQALASEAPQQCIAIHLNLLFAPPSPEALADGSDDDKAKFAQFRHFVDTESGYARIQSTKPQTLGYALHDSPVGQLAWITEKFRTWTDCDGVIENAVSRDELLTNVTLYWVTGTAGSSARLYRETQADQRDLRHYLETPTGLACFPGELVQAPRAWLEARVNLVHHEEMPRGGHFAALEQPELLVKDVRAFFRERR
jgi:pimeloyl-ACP methyl ester carboxylesterase